MKGQDRMGDRLWIHVVTAVTFALLLSGCQAKPQVAPPVATSATTNAPVTVPEKTNSRRETIFFIQGDATLSPGALDKLKTLTKSWGTKGTWTVACPSNPGITYDLLQKRILILRSELQKLGVSTIETKLLPKEPIGEYDTIYIVKEFP